jgi:hypothetical protein
VRICFWFWFPLSFNRTVTLMFCVARMTSKLQPLSPLLVEHLCYCSHKLIVTSVFTYLCKATAVPTMHKWG